MDDFFKTLFDEEDFTNFCDKLNDVTSIAVASCPINRPVTERFCLNALHKDKDMKPTRWWHASNKPRRADHNVTKHRNILIECDSVSIKEQLEWLARTNFPFTAVVHSGKKSLHIIVSLEKPVTKKQYRALVLKLYEAVVADGLIPDPTGKNPSRLTRYPDIIRGDTCSPQTLLALSRRIPKSELETWMKVRLKPRQKTERVQREKPVFESKRLSKATRELVEEGILSESSRHACFLKAASQMRKSGFELDEIESYLYDSCLALIPERPNELLGILNWVQFNVVPEHTNEET